MVSRHVHLAAIWRGGAWIMVNGVARGCVSREEESGLWDYSVRQPDGTHEFSAGGYPRRRDALEAFVRHELDGRVQSSDEEVNGNA